MKLYFSPGACSLAPHIVLRELNLPFDAVKVDLKAKKTEHGEDYLALNPKGYVPALTLDDGSLLTEGPTILQYLADRVPTSGLVPAAGTMERYRLEEWLGFINSELHKTLGALFNPALSDDAKNVFKERAVKRLAVAEEQLKHSQYLYGNAFSIADAYLVVMLFWCQRVKIDLSGHPALSAYFERLRARPAVAAAFAAEGLG